MSHSRLKQQCRIISNDCDDGASGRAGNSIAAEGKREWRGWNERVSLRRDEDRPKRWKPNTALISIQTMRGRVGLPGTILSFSLRTLRFYNSCEIVIKKTRAISIFVGEFSPIHGMERENVATVSRLEQAFVSRHSIRSSI